MYEILIKENEFLLSKGRHYHIMNEFCDHLCITWRKETHAEQTLLCFSKKIWSIENWLKFEIIIKRSRQIIRYRVTANLPRPKIKQCSASNEQDGCSFASAYVQHRLQRLITSEGANEGNLDGITGIWKYAWQITVARSEDINKEDAFI